MAEQADDSLLSHTFEPRHCFSWMRRSWLTRLQNRTEPQHRGYRLLLGHRLNTRVIVACCNENRPNREVDTPNNRPTAHRLWDVAPHTDRFTRLICSMVSGSGRLKVSGRKKQMKPLSSDSTPTTIHGRYCEITAEREREREIRKRHRPVSSSTTTASWIAFVLPSLFEYAGEAGQQKTQNAYT